MNIEITDEQLLFIYRFTSRSKIFFDMNLDPLNRSEIDNESLNNLVENLKNHVDKLGEHKKE